MFSEPVIGERFFGREEVLELLNKRVGALKDGYRQNVALTGQSLAGKSSIILHFLDSARGEGFVPIYVEVLKESFKSFSSKFIATMLYNVLTKLGEEAEVDFESLLKKAQTLLPKTSAAIKRVQYCLERGEFDEAYSDLLALTSVLKDESGLPCVVILDEFDNLESLGVKNPFLSFGKVIMVQKDTMYIVSSSRNEAIKKILSEKLSLLFGNFEIVKISNFNIKAAESFIDSKLAGFELSAPLKKFLIAFTDGNPFYLDKIASLAKETALEKMTSHIGKDVIVSAILELVFNSGGAIHQYILNFMLDILDTKSREDYLAILSAIANGRNKHSELSRTLRFKKADMSKSLARLIDLGLLSKNGVFYYIGDVILAFWMKFVYQRRKELLVGGTFDKMALFRKDMESYISDCLAEFDKDAASKLEELFNLFSNELVQIDGKNMKMPHFTKVEAKTFPNGKRYVASSFRANFWIAEPCELTVSENDIIEYIRNIKTLDGKIANKVIVALSGIDANAMLLAKELKIAVWDLQTINILLNNYGKPRITPL